ncbi:MAG: ADP-ribosylglycohydrolase family protein [Bacteroidaceae bacterium]|nr:ADP-ribosylglycohydrolase family protein [Bacteroidaceae bacterium]
MDETNRKQDLVRGSLIGGAAGDALGYPVEFMSWQEIKNRYGNKGITKYELTNGVAQISDDTQMTLFTANGMMMGLTRGYLRGIGGEPQFYVQYAYQDWYNTQTDSYHNHIDKEGKYKPFGYSWLNGIPELYSRRAPGNTCLSAIKEFITNHQTPQNNSKGCGGVMRVAPWPLFCACHEIRYSIEEIDVAGGEIARLTHKHPLGWMPAIVLSHILYRLVKEERLSSFSTEALRNTFAEIVEEALMMLPKLIVLNNVSELTWDKQQTLDEAFHKDINYFIKLIIKALSLAKNESSDLENIRLLGEGWVGEEALAIAIYAVARHIDSFEDALIAAVNHDGDSDSTGSIAGNIIGAVVGYEAIPIHFKRHLEIREVILSLADDLHQGCIISEYRPIETPEQKQWLERYYEMMPAFEIS